MQRVSLLCGLGNCAIETRGNTGGEEAKEGCRSHREGLLQDGVC